MTNLQKYKNSKCPKVNISSDSYDNITSYRGFDIKANINKHGITTYNARRLFLTGDKQHVNLGSFITLTLAKEAINYWLDDKTDW